MEEMAHLMKDLESESRRSLFEPPNELLANNQFSLKPDMAFGWNPSEFKLKPATRFTHYEEEDPKEARDSMHDQIEPPTEKSEEGEENHEESSEQSEVKQEESEKDATPAPMIHQEQEEEEPINMPEPEPDPVRPQTVSSVKEEVVQQMDLGDEDSHVEEPKIFHKEVRIRKHDKNREAPKIPLKTSTYDPQIVDTYIENPAEY